MTLYECLKCGYKFLREKDVSRCECPKIKKEKVYDYAKRREYYLKSRKK
jgi:predicted Zn-ribbon and HTH transcriptional regulator